MLSRVAENVYWLARYFERAEDLARLVISTSHAMLDMMPVSNVNPLNWEQLIAITGHKKIFYAMYTHADEESIADFLIRNLESPASLLTTLRLARENLRSTREIFPREAWEMINQLFLTTNAACQQSFTTANRSMILETVVAACLKINGLLQATMCRDEVFRMFTLGQYMERADMITRILDVRGALMLDGLGTKARPLRNALWLAVLKSISGDQMYRRQTRTRIRGSLVLAFLLTDQTFPRAFSYCMNEVESCLKSLGKTDSAWAIIAAIQEQLHLADMQLLAANVGLHTFLDQLQIFLVELHDNINQSYFNMSAEDLV